MIDILGSNAPLYLLQLLLEAARGIAEALEHSRYGAHITILLDDTCLIVGTALALFLHGDCRDKQLVGVGTDRETVVLVHRNQQRGTQSHICGQELAAVVAVI